MYVYDQVNNLAKAIQESKEYLEYKKIKEEVATVPDLKTKIDEFEEDDAFIYDGKELNLIDIIEQTLDFNIPARILCNDDCQGLCHECGANLNKQECSCSENANDEEIIDPRFAKLKDIFKND